MTDRQPTATHVVTAVGWVESSLIDLAAAPMQGHEGAPAARVRFDAAVRDAWIDLDVGDVVVLLTWLDRADRTILRVHPRDDPHAAERGVFSTRSPDRPNPIGLHRVTIVARDETSIEVHPLEAVNGTPVLDVKPVFDATDG